MFIPVNDQNPLKNISKPYVTWGIILVNFAVYAWQVAMGVEASNKAILAGGVTPFMLFGGALEEDLAALPGPVTLITYQFLHGSLLHVVGNMVFLYIFGDNIEDATGHVRFVFFYLICGMVAGFVHSAVTPMSIVPLIGASGATSGLVGAYLILHPRVRFWVLALGKIPLRLKAYWIIGAWVLWQIGSIIFGWVTNEKQEIAWFAHLGGFAIGVVLIIVMRQANVPLWDKDLVIPGGKNRTEEDA